MSKNSKRILFLYNDISLEEVSGGVEFNEFVGIRWEVFIYSVDRLIVKDDWGVVVDEFEGFHKW